MPTIAGERSDDRVRCVIGGRVTRNGLNYFPFLNSQGPPNID